MELARPITRKYSTKTLTPYHKEYHSLTFPFPYHCPYLVLSAGTPTLIRTNSKEASTSCSIMACSHERGRQVLLQRDTHVNIFIWFFFSILFDLIWFDLILLDFIIFYPLICVYAHLVCPDFRKARLLTFSTTSNRSYTKRDEHTHASSLPTHASVIVFRRTCISITALRVWFFSVKSVSHHIAHPLA
jgi:hypothetical protein